MDYLCLAHLPVVSFLTMEKGQKSAERGCVRYGDKS